MAKTHDIRRWPLIIAGIPMSGFADGDVFSLEFDNDDWTDKTGADGESVRSYIPGNPGTLTISLLSTSLSNDALDAARKLDAATGLAQFPVLLKNISGTESWAAAQAWVMRPAGVSVGQESGTREWKIRSGNWTGKNGGQPLPF